MYTKKRKKVNIVTLGCSKNTVDSERIAAQLTGKQYDIVHNGVEEAFDTVIVNTCGFIESAKEESIEQIIYWTKVKGKGSIEKLYVTGCLSQRYQQELSLHIPEVDAWFGTMDMAALVQKMKVNYRQELVGSRLLATPSHYAYVKISEGCNRTCSFCAIPLMRGYHVSRTIEQLVGEVTDLARKGVREIMLIAQELTYYGLDIYKKRSLHLLLERLASVKGIEWIRLHYAYPDKFPMEVIEVMRSQPSICNYLDMPLQHASNRILASMRRRTTVTEMHALLDAIQARIPHITTRTTMIVGYPGETKEDFKELITFVQQRRFDRLGVFMYSHEESTKAYELDDTVTAEEKEHRYKTLMEIQQEISRQKNEQTIESVVKVLVDKKENDVYIGRTEQDSPEVDNEVIVVGGTNLTQGDMIKARITQAYEYDREATFESYC